MKFRETVMCLKSDMDIRPSVSSDQDKHFSHTSLDLTTYWLVLSFHKSSSRGSQRDPSQSHHPFSLALNPTKPLKFPFYKQAGKVPAGQSTQSDPVKGCICRF